MSAFDGMRLFWGDLHNHNAVGYAKGSLARSIEVAREHLDFFAFTGHASWHDMPLMPADRHMHWVKGFEAHTRHWPKTRAMIQEANHGDFAAFLGYEWHSSAFGDYCLIFPEDQSELFLPDHPSKLLAFALQKGALAIPHHVAYARGWRGANWDHFDPRVSPVVEIFSEHGCTFSDRAPYPMILHSNGGRSASNTVTFQLERGLRFGFVASTDDHFGYPGAYGEGVVGVWAPELTRSALMEAIRARRTVAVTGDRIGVQFSLNGAPMGAELPATPERGVEVAASSPEPIEMIELVRSGRTIQRFFPEDLAQPLSLPGRARCRIQYGWGPWSALDLERVCSWEMSVRIRKGRFLGLDRCFQSGPYVEELRDRARQTGEREIRLSSFTSRRQAYLEDPTKAVVLDLEADAEAVLEIELRKPAAMTVEVPVRELLRDNRVTFTGVFTSESFVIHRLVGPEESSARVRWEDTRPAAGPEAYFVRVRQHNNHWAWTSPIWVG